MSTDVIAVSLQGLRSLLHALVSNLFAEFDNLPIRLMYQVSSEYSRINAL